MGDVVEFITMNGHQKVFYKITSSAINFEVKAPGNAGIGLAKKLGPKIDFLIALGNERRSWIKNLRGGEVKETAETPNILSTQEYRRFWISWNGNAIRLGGEGHSNPIVSCNCKATDMKYVTFFVISPHLLHFPVHWKVELPPVIEKPIPKPISTGELTWVPIDAETVVLPDGALIGGYEKENLYIVRAKHRGSWTPGKFVPTEGSAYISWIGESHVKTSYEVLCGYDCMWVPATKHRTQDRIPVGAVVGGHLENMNNEKLYIGRVKHLDHIIPGRIQPSHRVCYVSYDGKEVGVDNYEILVVPDKNRCANTLLVPHIEMNIDSEDDDDDDSMFDQLRERGNFALQAL